MDWHTVISPSRRSDIFGMWLVGWPLLVSESGINGNEGQMDPLGSMSGKLKGHFGVYQWLVDHEYRFCFGLNHNWIGFPHLTFYMRVCTEFVFIRNVNLRPSKTPRVLETAWQEVVLVVVFGIFDVFWPSLMVFLTYDLFLVTSGLLSVPYSVHFGSIFGPFIHFRSLFLSICVIFGHFWTIFGHFWPFFVIFTSFSILVHLWWNVVRISVFLLIIHQKSLIIHKPH